MKYPKMASPDPRGGHAATLDERRALHEVVVVGGGAGGLELVTTW